MHKKICLLVLILFCFCFRAVAYDALEVSAGWLDSDIREGLDYRGFILTVGFDYQADAVLSSSGFNPGPDFAFVLEPFVSAVSDPDTNLELGTNFLLKYTLPFWTRVKPYLKGGVGIMYMTQHTREQSTQFNFLPQAGAGMHFFIDDSVAFNLEYRFRHLSNCDLKKPNKGIDSDIFLTGVSFFF